MNRIIFFVEEEKTEAKIIEEISKYLADNKYVLIKEDINKINNYSMYTFEDEVDVVLQVYVKVISNADVVKFYKDYIYDPFAEGINLSSYYISNLNFEFNLEFIMVDYDPKDLVTLEFNSKKEFLLSFYNLVEQLDNTYFLVSSPMIESIVDIYNSEFEVSKNYKKYIGDKVNGCHLYLRKNFIDVIQNNDLKLKNINYFDQRKYVIEVYDGGDKIMVYNLINHILCEYFIFYEIEEIIEILSLSYDKINGLKQQKSIIK